MLLFNIKIEMPKKLTLHALDILLKNRFKEGFLSLKDLPQPSSFKDMDKATQRIVQAIKNKEKIIRMHLGL